MLKKLLSYKFNAFANLLEMICMLRDCIEVNLLAMIFWLIWNKRNSGRLGNEFTETPRIQHKVMTLLKISCMLKPRKIGHLQK